MNIIQETLEIITKAYEDNLQKALRGNINISDFTKNLETALHRAGTLMVGEVLETLFFLNRGLYVGYQNRPIDLFSHYGTLS